LIKFRNDSIHSILASFDLDICCFAYDGKEVYALDQAREAVTSGQISAPLEHRSWRAHERLLKYVSRGFGIRIPNLNFPVDGAALLTEGTMLSM